MKIRGLKTSTDFLLFPFHEGHKILHERERATHPAFLRADTIRLLADFLIASANRIRKSADTIRKPTERIRRFCIKNARKNQKSSRNLPLFQDFARFFLPAKTKMPQKFWQKAKRRAFLKFSEKGILSNFRKVLDVLGQVGLVGQVRDSVERSAYRTGPTRRTLPSSNKASQESQVAAKHSPLWGRWRGLFPSPAFF